MAAVQHYNLPGTPQLVHQQSFKDEICFYVDRDFQRYLDLLQEYSQHYNCQIHAYVLMPNQVYILATPFSNHGISHMMQDLAQAYSRYINSTYGRTGSVWSNGYKSSVIEADQQLLNCMRYVESIPQRVHVVTSSADYLWSSFQFNALNKKDAVIEPHAQFLELVSRSEQQSHQAYNELCIESLDESLIKEIETALNQQLALGSSTFIEKIKTASAVSRKYESECTDCVMQY